MRLLDTEYGDIKIMLDEGGAFAGILTPDGIEASSADAAYLDGRRVLSTCDAACRSVRRILVSQLGLELPQGFAPQVGAEDLAIFCTGRCTAGEMEEYLRKKRAATLCAAQAWSRERPWDTNPMTLAAAREKNFSFDAGTGVLVTDGHHNSAGFLELPSSIDGRRVTAVGTYAFVSYTYLETVVIPDSVVHLEPCAFYDKVHLKYANIPKDVKTIAEGTFSRCISLASIVIPPGVEEICDEAFFKCSSLDTVTIPDSVRRIGRCAFLNVPHIIYRGEARGFPWGATVGN